MLLLALRLFQRMLKAGQFHLLLSALIIATTSITAITLFVERIEHTLYDEATTFIAADAKIQGSLAIKPEWLEHAKSLKLNTAQYQGFNAMVFSNSGMKLAQVKAVNESYPLKGTLTIKKEATEQTVRHGPAPGTLWLAPRLLSSLNIQLGERIKIGQAEFLVDAILIKEPDNASSQFGISPRVMIHIDDATLTGAMQLGSRIKHALLLSGDPESIDTFKHAHNQNLGEHFRWITPKDGSRALTTAVERAQRFLLLAGSLSVILAGLAIAISAQQFARNQQSQVALLKSFGLRAKHIRSLYISLFLFLCLVGIVLGNLTGWLVHHGLLFILADLLPQKLASAGIKAYILGSVSAFITLFAFAAPPLLALKNIPPSQIFRQTAGRFLALRSSAALGLLAMCTLLWWYSQNLQITAILIAILFSTIIVSSLCAALLLRLIKFKLAALRGVIKIGLSNLQRQPKFTGLQIFVFANIFMLALVLVQVRTNLIDNWKPSIENTPNHFIFNIFESDLDDIKTALQNSAVPPHSYYPMARGRLISINNSPIKENINPDQQRNNYQRELNLTWSDTFGKDNSISAGEWWQPQDNNYSLQGSNITNSNQEPIYVSAEHDYAKGLNLEIGDTLSFSVAGNIVEAQLRSIRKVKWDSMNPNFFMIFNQAIVEAQSANWITSIYLAPNQSTVLNEITSTFPTISVIELEQTLAMIRNIVKRVSMAIEFILSLVILASLLVLITSIRTSLAERMRENALLRSLGASRYFIQKILIVEFVSIGLIAGLFAVVSAELALYFIQTRIFEAEYSVHWMMWIYSPVLSAGIIALTGSAATWVTTRVAPMQVLRASE